MRDTVVFLRMIPMLDAGVERFTQHVGVAELEELYRPQPPATSLGWNSFAWVSEND